MWLKTNVDPDLDLHFFQATGKILKKVMPTVHLQGEIR